MIKGYIFKMQNQKQGKSSRQTFLNLIYLKKKFKIYNPKSCKIINFDRLQKGLANVARVAIR